MRHMQHVDAELNVRVGLAGCIETGAGDAC